MVYKVIGNITLVDALSHIYKGEIIDPLVNRFYKGTSVLQGQRLVESCKSPCKSVYKGNDTNHLVNHGFTRGFTMAVAIHTLVNGVYKGLPVNPLVESTLQGQCQQRPCKARRPRPHELNLIKL